MKLILSVLLIGNSLLFAQQKTKNEVNITISITQRSSDSLKIQDEGTFKKWVTINKAGTFKANFNVKEGIYYFSIGGNYAKVYLKNKAKIAITLDEKAFDQSLKFEGNFSKENTFLNNQATIDDAIESKELSPKEMLPLYNERLTEGNKILQDTPLDEGFKKIYKESFEKNIATYTNYYNDLLKADEMIGKPSPSFDYENHAGGKTTLEDLRGKYVYIDVWATWCRPCREELPAMKIIEEKYHNAPIAFVSISIDTKEDYGKWKEFVSKKELRGIQLIADRDWKSAFVEAFYVKGIPRFILIDPKGNVINPNAPRPSEQKLIEILDGLSK